MSLLSDKILVERCQDDVFYFRRRNSGDRSERFCFEFSVQVRQRNIVAITKGGLGRVGRHHAVIRIVEQKSGQQMVARVSRDDRVVH